MTNQDYFKYLHLLVEGRTTLTYKQYRAVMEADKDRERRDREALEETLAALEAFRNKDVEEEDNDEGLVCSTPKEAVCGTISGNFNHVNALHTKKGEFEEELATFKRSKRFQNIGDETLLDLNATRGYGWRNHPFEVTLPEVLSAGNYAPGYSKVYGHTTNNDDYNESPEYLVGNIVRKHRLNVKDYNNNNDSEENEVIRQLLDKMFWMPVSKRTKEDNDVLFATDYSRHVFFSKPKESRGDGELNLWFRDSKNSLSAIRPIFLNDYLTRFTSYGAEEISKFDNSGYYNRRTQYVPDYKRDAFSKIPTSKYLIDKIENALDGKIVVVEHRRINTFVSNRNGHFCPILESYLKKGYELVEDDGSEEYIQNAIFKSFKKQIMNNSLNFEEEGVDKGLYRETKYKSIEFDNVGRAIPTSNKSINIVRTVIIDISKSLLLDQDVVYNRETDLLFGRIYDGIEFDRYNHPYSKKNNRTEESDVFTLEYHYCEHQQPPFLYVNTHGHVTKLVPVRDIIKEPGLCCVKIDKHGNVTEKMIHPKDYSKYGVFYSKSQAEAFNALKGDVIDYNEAHSALSRVALEQRIQEAKIRELDRIEQIKNLDYKYKLGEGALRIQEQELKQQNLAIASVEKEREHEMKIRELLIRLEEQGIKREMLDRELKSMDKKEGLEWLKYISTALPMVTKLLV